MSAAILLAAGITSFAGVQPQLAAGGGAVYVTFAAADAISVARSTDAGATFATPVILPGAGKLALGRLAARASPPPRDAVSSRRSPAPGAAAPTATSSSTARSIAAAPGRRRS